MTALYIRLDSRKTERSLKDTPNIILKESLSDSQLVVQFAIWMIIFQLIHSIIQGILLNIFEVTADN